MKVLKKQICINGHDTHIWGRTSSQACRACVKDRHLLKNYGISLQEFINIFDYQNGRCCVCNRDLGSYLPNEFGKASRIEVDHDHKIKNKRDSVRGLLCGGRWKGCNRKLGHIDDSAWLASAAKYIANPPAQMFLKGNQ